MSRTFAPSALSGLTIQIVEDDDDAREMLELLFVLCGATVVVAASGNAGWREFQARQPDILISDLRMPDGDGYELIRRIRALPAEQGGLIPALALSATDGPEQALEAGFHAHLTKPADPLALVDTIRGFVHEGTGTRSTWVLSASEPAIALLTFDGHPTADDMRAATRSLTMILATSTRHVVVDLRRITGFDPAVGSVAERAVWKVRHNISGATIVGGSVLARLVAMAACMALGVSCTLVDSWPIESPSHTANLE